VDLGLDETVEILFTNYAPSQVEQAPHLRWLQLASAGINHVMQSPIYERKDIRLTTGRGVYDVAGAEFTLGLMLSLIRNLPAAVDLQRRKEWCDNNDRLKLFLACELRGKTVGIVGYGGIGQEVARLSSAFGMRPSALIRKNKSARELRYRVPELRRLRRPPLENIFNFPNGLRPLLRRSDFLVITAPLTWETEGLIDDSALACMKPTAYLINVARGPIVKQDALIAALREKRIAGAALDVFPQEPLPPNSPLYALDNIIVTPHISGAFEDMFERASALFVENFERYRAGKTLFNLVNRRRGY
jgi:phosphoglycerate dehydrogenase-like enzyme